MISSTSDNILSHVGLILDGLGAISGHLGHSWCHFGQFGGPSWDDLGYSSGIFVSQYLYVLLSVTWYYLVFPSLLLVSVLPYPHISVSSYLGSSMSLYLHEFEFILEMRFQALRLESLISVSRHLHEVGHLGDMLSSFGILFKKPSWSILVYFRQY